MNIALKNYQIYFCIETIWDSLDYKFKYLLNQLVTANSDYEFEQTVPVPESILIDIYRAVTAKPEGVSAGINGEINQSLFTQINPLSNLPAVMQGKEQPNEAARILIEIKAINDANDNYKAAKILNGKTQILA